MTDLVSDAVQKPFHRNLCDVLVSLSNLEHLKRLRTFSIPLPTVDNAVSATSDDWSASVDFVDATFEQELTIDAFDLQRTDDPHRD